MAKIIQLTNTVMNKQTLKFESGAELLKYLIANRYLGSAIQKLHTIPSSETDIGGGFYKGTICNFDSFSNDDKLLISGLEFVWDKDVDTNYPMEVEVFFLFHNPSQLSILAFKEYPHSKLDNLHKNLLEREVISQDQYESYQNGKGIDGFTFTYTASGFWDIDESITPKQLSKLEAFIDEIEENGSRCLTINSQCGTIEISEFISSYNEDVTIDYFVEQIIEKANANEHNKHHKIAMETLTNAYTLKIDDKRIEITPSFRLNDLFPLDEVLSVVNWDFDYTIPKLINE